jgi:hypothetical protein
LAFTKEYDDYRKLGLVCDSPEVFTKFIPEKIKIIRNSPVIQIFTQIYLYKVCKYEFSPCGDRGKE